MPEPLRLAPAPFEDEALSSWVSRTALRYGASGPELLGYLGLEALDPDAAPAARQIAAMAAGTGVPERLLRGLADRQRQFIGRPRDLLQRDLETGLRGAVCPACLATDDHAGATNISAPPG